MITDGSDLALHGTARSLAVICMISPVLRANPYHTSSTVSRHPRRFRTCGLRIRGASGPGTAPRRGSVPDCRAAAGARRRSWGFPVPRTGANSVEDDEGMLARGNPLSNLPEMAVHLVGFGLRANMPDRGPGRRGRSRRTGSRIRSGSPARCAVAFPSVPRPLRACLSDQFSPGLENVALDKPDWVEILRSCVARMGRKKAEEGGKRRARSAIKVARDPEALAKP